MIPGGAVKGDCFRRYAHDYRVVRLEVYCSTNGDDKLIGYSISRAAGHVSYLYFHCLTSSFFCAAISFSSFSMSSELTSSRASLISVGSNSIVIVLHSDKVKDEVGSCIDYSYY